MFCGGRFLFSNPNQIPTMKKFFTLIAVFQILALLASVALTGFVIYVAWHFISKLW